MDIRHDQLADPAELMGDDPPITSVMTAHLVAITPDAPLRTALRLMASNNVRHLPVLDGPHCVGVIGETDLVHAVAVGGPRLVGPLARPVPMLPITARRAETAAAVLAGDVDAALVVDGARLIGIVTATDLVRSLAEGPHDQEVTR
jgi:CBS domain-containing protein